MPLLFENKSHDEIELIQEWIKVRAYVNEHFGQKPDIQSLLFLIGVNEYGDVREFEKEEKQDLMHIGMCTILEGTYYAFDHLDADHWPHFRELEPLPAMFIKTQEAFIKSKIIDYFKKNIY